MQGACPGKKRGKKTLSVFHWRIPEARHRGSSNITLPLVYFSLFELFEEERKANFIETFKTIFKLIVVSQCLFQLSARTVLLQDKTEQQANQTLLQGGLPVRFCGRWSRAHSWFPGRVPQDGDNVTVERGQWLLLDANTSILNLLHVKGLWSLSIRGGIMTYPSITFREQAAGSFG